MRLQLAQHLERARPNLEAVCRTLLTGRAGLVEREAWLVETLDDAISALRSEPGPSSQRGRAKRGGSDLRKGSPA